MAKRTRGRTEAEIQADKLRTGRPRKEPVDRQSEAVTVYLTPEERTQLEAQAKKEGIAMATLILREWRKGGTGDGDRSEEKTD